MIASDGYRSGLVAGLDDIVQATRGQVVATEPLPKLLRPHYARRGTDYWQQLPDGELVAGGSATSRSSSSSRRRSRPRPRSGCARGMIQGLVEVPASDHAPLVRDLRNLA